MGFKRCSSLLLMSMVTGTAVPAVGQQSDDGQVIDNPSQRSIEQSLRLDAETNANPLAISTYKPNYILPIDYNSHLPNKTDYRIAGSGNHAPQHTEFKYQISLKVALGNNLIGNNGDLFLGYTQYSLWQAYNSRDSAPFRETNYEPELFLRFSNNQTFFGWTNTINRIGFIHQSNGRGGDVDDGKDTASRSWNRLYAETILQRGRWSISLMPWWRIPDSHKSDNNPDIDQYMGYGKVGVLYTTAKGHEISLQTVGNPFKGHLGNELDYTFPLFGRVRGMIQYYNGYGETLIDYNHRVNRFGLGVSFNPLLPGAAETPVPNGVGSEAARAYEGNHTDTSVHQSADIASNDVPSGSVNDDVINNSGMTDLERERAARSYFETRAQSNPLSLSTYHRNYILPIAYNTKSVNHQDFRQVAPSSSPDHNEIKFQLSIKARLWHNMFGNNGNLYAAYTQRSWWQAYNSSASSPFRETNYEPELFINFTNNQTFWGWTNVSNNIGFMHDSNGRADPISRSWNRLYVETTFDKGPMELSFRPWWRIPESKHNDDNPDIDSYMGYGQVSFSYTRNNQEFSWTVVGNPGKGHFGNQLEYSFPLWSKLHGFLQYYHGYGESLIDYNHKVNRLGVGISFNNINLGAP